MLFYLYCQVTQRNVILSYCCICVAVCGGVSGWCLLQLNYLYVERMYLNFVVSSFIYFFFCMIILWCEMFIICFGFVFCFYCMSGDEKS